MTMEDIEVGMGDIKTRQTLEDAFGYKKQKVAFQGMESLKSCSYLGGLAQGFSAPYEVQSVLQK
jgi:hypothetical protein